MRANFEDLFKLYPMYNPYKDNKEARYIFDILSADDNIIKMIEVNDLGKPALSAVIVEIERYHDSLTNPQFDLKDQFTKRALGMMVKIILAPFGYESDSQKDIPKALKSKYVKGAMVYKLTGKPVLKVEKRIVEA